MNMPDVSVYVIDKDWDLLRSIKSFLDKKGFQVTTFFKWEIAFEAMKNYKPRIILLDVFLNSVGGVDGLNLCRKLKNSPYTRKIPVLLLSGAAKIDTRAVNDCGASDFIEKPFDFDELATKINSVLLSEELK